MVEAIFLSNVEEIPAKFGSFKWLDMHLKPIIMALTIVESAFSVLLLVYVRYLFGTSSQDMSNQYLAITCLIFAATTLISNAVGIVGVGLSSDSYLWLFKYNNMWVSAVSVLLSGIHFAKGAFVLRDVKDNIISASTFMSTAVGFLFMAISYGSMIYLLSRFTTLKRSAVVATEIKLNDTIVFSREDLNATQTGNRLDPSNRV